MIAIRLSAGWPAWTIAAGVVLTVSVIGGFVWSGFRDVFLPMELLTIGLLTFAGVQILVPYQAERRARARQQDSDYQIVWAEWFRLDGMADNWVKQDLVDEAELGTLDPHAVLPRDWSTLMSAASRLSIESGMLAAIAITLGHDLARVIAHFSADIQRRQDIRRQTSSTILRSLAPPAPQLDPDFRDQEKKIKARLREVARIFRDATMHSTAEEKNRTFRFREDAQSYYARAIGQKLGGKAPSGDVHSRMDAEIEDGRVALLRVLKIAGDCSTHLRERGP